MAWIELHQSLPTHRKTLILADLLDIVPVTAMGRIVALWLWALDNAPDGELGAIPVRTLGQAVGWTDDPDVLVNALIKAGFLDRIGDDRLVIHDWYDYTGKLMGAREALARKRSSMRQAYQNGTIQAVRERDGDYCRYCGAKVDWADRNGRLGGTYDHVDPTDAPVVANLVVCCRSCNSAKKKQTAQEAGLRLRPAPSHDSITSRSDALVRSGDTSDALVRHASAHLVPYPTVPNSLNTIGPAARAREDNQAAEPAQLALVPVVALEPIGRPQDVRRTSASARDASLVKVTNDPAIDETRADWQTVTGRHETYAPGSQIVLARASFPRDALLLAMQHFWSDWWWRTHMGHQSLGWFVGDLNRVQALINLAPRTEDECVGADRLHPGQKGRQQWRPPEWDRAQPADLAYYEQLDRAARDRVQPGAEPGSSGEGEARAG